MLPQLAIRMTIKDQLHDEASTLIRMTSMSDSIFIIYDLSIGIGRDHATQPSVISYHHFGNINEDG